LTSAQFQQTFDELAGQGFRLVRVCGNLIGPEARLAGIWEKVDGPSWLAYGDLTSTQYEQRVGELTGQGFRLAQLSACAVDEGVRFVALWEQRDGPPIAAHHGLTSAQLQRAYNELDSRGFRMVQVSGYAIGGEAHYVAIWEQREGPPVAARYGLTAAQYEQESDVLAGQGFRLVHISGYSIN
jgi:Polyglycine hydrolase-like, structural repeat